MAFDLDSYVRKNAPAKADGGFDLDAYVAKNAAPSEQKTSAGQTALESYGNAATLGYLPQIQAATEPAFTAVMNKLTGNNVEVDQSFVERRDENLKRQALQSKENPWSSRAGTLAGIGASALLPAGYVAKGTTTAAKAIAGAKTGALMGALANPGDMEGEVQPFQVNERAINAALGGAAGGILSAGASKLAEKAPAMKEWLGDSAAGRAWKALGGGKRANEVAMAKGEDLRVGRQLLDEGAIPRIGTPGRIAKRVERLKEEAGQEIGAILDDVDSRTVDYTPVKFKSPKKPVVVQEEVRMTPIRIDENPSKRAFPWLKDADAPAKVIRGEEQAIQSKLLEIPKPSIEAGKVRTVPGEGMTVDMTKIAKDVKASPEFKQLSDQFGTDAAQKALDQYLDRIGSKGKLQLRAAQKQRQNVDAGINHSKRAADLSPAEEVLMTTRTAIRDAMNEVANKLPGRAKDSLLKANKRYSGLETASDLLDKKMAGNAANQTFGLGDKLSTVAGLTTGNGWIGLAAGAANKAARSFGNSAVARAIDASAKATGMAGTVAGKVSPRVAGLLAGSGAGAARTTGFTESDLSDPSLLEEFRKNPQLLENVSDPKIRAILERNLGRKPSAIERRAKSAKTN